MARYDYDNCKGYCTQAKEDFDLDADCCTSCHSEFHEGWTDPLEIHRENGDYYYVCCEVADAYKVKVESGA